VEAGSEDVIVKQPVLAPREVHQYASGCHLKSGIGKMLGYYTMDRIIDSRVSCICYS